MKRLLITFCASIVMASLAIVMSGQAEFLTIGAIAAIWLCAVITVGAIGFFNDIR